jgi:hypothetical protein
MDDRSAVVKGCCAVIVTLPEDQQKTCLDKMLSLTTARMVRQKIRAQEMTGVVQKNAIGFLADEVDLLAYTISFLAEAPQTGDDAMESGCHTSSDPRIPIPAHFLQQIKASWHLFLEFGRLWADHKVCEGQRRDCVLIEVFRKCVASSVSALASGLIPSTKLNETIDCDLLRELLALVTLVHRKGDINWEVDFKFVEELFRTHGTLLEIASMKAKEGNALLSDAEREVGRIAEASIMLTISMSQVYVENHWGVGGTQKNGQSPLEASPSRTKPEQNSNSTAGGLFQLLSIGLVRCPVFLLHQPAQQIGNAEEDGLLPRAVTSALICLADYSPDLMETAALFLVSLVRTKIMIDLPCTLSACLVYLP